VSNSYQFSSFSRPRRGFCCNSDCATSRKRYHFLNSEQEEGNKARKRAQFRRGFEPLFFAHPYHSLFLSLFFNLFPFSLSLSLSAFRFDLPGASTFPMAGRLRGGGTGVSTTDAPSTSKPSSSSSFFASIGRKSNNAPRFFADLAAAARKEEEDDDAYDSDSGSESDSESSGSDEQGWKTRKQQTKQEQANQASNNNGNDDANFNSYEPKGFEPDLGIRVIKGDGKCMFRALARGMARNKGVVLTPEDETRDADTLRLAVRDALCRSDERRRVFSEAVTSVEVAEGGIPKYCARLNDAGFWGGEVELMVISRLLQVPIYIYRSSKEAGVEKIVGYGFAPIVKYGEQYAGVSEDGEGQGLLEESSAAGGFGGRKPVNLLYREGNHYDLLVA